MPYLALIEHGIEKTAFDCRDEYRRDEIRHTKFSCPFCEVGYFAKCIYDAEETGKAPHFSLFPKKPHLGDCNGEPIEEDLKKGKEVAQSFEKREYQIPEKFIQRQEPRQVRGTLAAPKASPDSDEIRQRRVNSRRIHGRARYTSSLLQTFVEARNFLVTQGFKKAKEKALKGNEQSKLISDLTSSYPLDLFGQHLNYNSAFWSANTVRNGARECIFHAKNGEVTMTSTGFQIETSIPSGKSDKVTAIVRCDNLSETAKDIPRSHQRLLALLTDMAKAERQLKWYAYGKMLHDATVGLCTLQLTNLDYLFVEAA